MRVEVFADDEDVLEFTVRPPEEFAGVAGVAAWPPGVLLRDECNSVYAMRGVERVDAGLRVAGERYIANVGYMVGVFIRSR